MRSRSNSASAPGIPGRLRRHEVRENLEKMILAGAQQPGSKLLQQELATRFGVVQGVVREALLELQAHGLVETINNRGIFVTDLSRERITEAFQVREMHEALAVQLCCERVSRGELRPLEEMAREIYDLGTAKKLNAMSRLDREFHARLVQLSRHSMLIRPAESYRVLGKFVQANRAPKIVRDEHLAILSAIERGATGEAERLMRAHVSAARLEVEKKLASGRARLEWVK